MHYITVNFIVRVNDWRNKARISSNLKNRPGLGPARIRPGPVDTSNIKCKSIGRHYKWRCPAPRAPHLGLWGARSPLAPMHGTRLVKSVHAQIKVLKYHKELIKIWKYQLLCLPSEKFKIHRFNLKTYIWKFEFDHSSNSI